MTSATERRSLLGALAVLVGCAGGAPGAAGDPAAGPATAAPSATTSPSAPPSASGAAPAGQDPVEPLAAVTWLVGSWRGEVDGATIEERWSAPAAGVMRGEGRTTKAGREVSREELRIEARAGEIVYVAAPGGAPPTEFLRDARISGPQVATFVNDAHDWPTRIRYERVGDELRVTVRGRPGQSVERWTLRPAPP